MVTSIAPAARKALMAHPWPGNVRELKNSIESMVVIDSDGVLDVDDLTEDLAPAPPGSVDPGAGGPRATSSAGRSTRSRSTTSLETLKLAGGNREEASRLLGIGERTLYRKIKEYGIG